MKAIDENKSLERNRKYFGIIFDWHFNNATRTVPHEAYASFQRFSETIEKNYIKCSENILISKANQYSAVGTIVEFKQIINSFPNLKRLMVLETIELINFDMEGDIKQFL